MTANLEVPECLKDDNVHTEGELLKQAEIVNWIVDSKKTFQILAEQNKELYESLYKGFLKDLEYLVKIGKISEESIDEILNF